VHQSVCGRGLLLKSRSVVLGAWAEGEGGGRAEARRVDELTGLVTVTRAKLPRLCNRCTAPVPTSTTFLHLPPPSTSFHLLPSPSTSLRRCPPPSISCHSSESGSQTLSFQRLRPAPSHPLPCARGLPFEESERPCACQTQSDRRGNSGRVKAQQVSSPTRPVSPPPDLHLRISTSGSPPPDLHHRIPTSRSLERPYGPALTASPSAARSLGLSVGRRPSRARAREIRAAHRVRGPWAPV
jgi:hypothetical protein